MGSISSLIKVFLFFIVGLVTCNDIGSHLNQEESSSKILDSSFYLQVCSTYNDCTVFYFKKIKQQFADTLGKTAKNPYLCTEPTRYEKVDTITIFIP
jgi:hypothetical protein